MIRRTSSGSLASARLKLFGCFLPRSFAGRACRLMSFSNQTTTTIYCCPAPSGWRPSTVSMTPEPAYDHYRTNQGESNKSAAEQPLERLSAITFFRFSFFAFCRCLLEQSGSFFCRHFVVTGTRRGVGRDTRWHTRPPRSPPSFPSCPYVQIKSNYPQRPVRNWKPEVIVGCERGKYEG